MPLSDFCEDDSHVNIWGKVCWKSFITVGWAAFSNFIPIGSCLKDNFNLVFRIRIFNFSISNISEGCRREHVEKRCGWKRIKSLAVACWKLPLSKNDPLKKIIHRMTPKWPKLVDYMLKCTCAPYMTYW